MDRRIGAQLYTARDFLTTNEDFYESMKKIKEIGYEQIQASGLGISDADYIKKVCDEFGLEITCTHRPLDNYINKIDEEIKYHKTLGCKIAGLGSMPPEYRDELKVKEFVEVMNGIYDKLKKEGIEFAYHNHSFEFLKYEGEYVMDYFIKHGKFSFIVDTYWLAYAGINPVDFIKKLGKRAICVHFKDLAMKNITETKMAPVGCGNLDWEKIITTCEEAGVKYALVEQDECEEDPFICLKKSYDYLKDLMSPFTLSGFSDEIDSNIEEQFKVLNKLGSKYFEPRGINGKNISTLTEDEIKNLKEAMNKYGIKASSIGSPIGKISIKDDFIPHLELFKKIVKTAKELDSKYIRIFSFFIPSGEDASKYKDEVIERLKAFVKIAEENDIILLHENEKDIYGDTAKRCREILEEINSPYLRCVFDPANFVQCDVETYPYAFNLLKPYIEYMHIKDADENKNIVPAGMGIGNIEKILSSLKESGYKGFVSLEPHLGSFEGLQDLELDDKMLDLPKSGEGTFTLAFDKLKRIIDNI